MQRSHLQYPASTFGLAGGDPALDRNPAPLRLVDPSPSRGLSVLQPPPPREQSDVDSGSTDDRPSPLTFPSDFPVTEKTTTTQAMLRKHHERMDVGGTQETERELDSSMVGTCCPQSRSLDEEQTGVEGSLDTSSLGVVGQDFVDGDKDTVGSYSNVLISDSCYDSSGDLLFKMDTNVSVVGRTHSRAPRLDVQGDVYEEVSTTVTSHYPLVQKMCHIDFSLVAEEEKPSK